MNTDRREFMRILGLLGTSLYGPVGFAIPSEDPDVPREPERTGRLTSVEKADLTELFLAVDRIWRLGGHCTLDAAAFGEVLDTKTTRPPSYLVAYRAARDHYLPLRAAHGVDEACRALYLENAAPQPMKRFVLGEFIALTYAFGGFRAFGFANTAGQPGGGFTDPRRPPYRIMERA